MRLQRPTRGLRWYFDHNDGHLIDKWDHYFEIYERHLRRFRGASPRMLEIGVSHGGSLQMWRYYFGRGARIVGLDIDPRVTALAQPGISIEVGSQADTEFLEDVARRHGPFDIVLDDGSHWYEDQRASLHALWPHVSIGGVYMVEDVHTSYMPTYEGRAGRPDTFIGETRTLIDLLHGYWPLDEARDVDLWTTSLGSVHVHDSIVVLDKIHRDRPRRRMTGRPAFDTLYGYAADELIDPEHRAQLASLGRPMARVRRSVRDPRAAYERLRRRFGH